jgi:cephalosporin hydroxylase
LIFFASLLELLGGSGEVLGIDSEIRPHNRVEIEGHPLSRRITLLEGSSLDEAIISRSRAFAQAKQTVMLCLDSNHTHDHVLGELQHYTPLVSVGSYAVVFDGVIEEMPESFSADRPWGPGNSPLTALNVFLKKTSDFVVDRKIEQKLVITAAPSGYLRRVK